MTDSSIELSPLAQEQLANLAAKLNKSPDDTIDFCHKLVTETLIPKPNNEGCFAFLDLNFSGYLQLMRLKETTGSKTTFDVLVFIIKRMFLLHDKYLGGKKVALSEEYPNSNITVTTIDDFFKDL